MKSVVNIGVIGDYDGRPSHMATNEALRHCAAALGAEARVQWLPTEALENERGESVLRFDGVWCAPGSPYKSMRGALCAIRQAREHDIPFIGTCGGFQHAAIEYARNVLGLISAGHQEYNPDASDLFITAMACSLAGQTRMLKIVEGTRIHGYYAQAEVEERYNCSFGLNPIYQKMLEDSGFRTAGTDETGEARILEMDKNRFHVATLFVPQMISTPEKPHKLILAFLASAMDYRPFSI